MRGIFQSFVLFLFVLMMASCSRQKSTFFTRNYHAVTAKDNAMFNGNNALIDGQEELALSYRDNYWEILPVERFEQFEQITKPGTSKDPNFERAEEKAAKAIQRHSMDFDGKEHNPQIDEAYILLGKARYYDQRFVPALDAFNFILNRYPTSNSINRAKMWKAKTNIRLRNEEIAIRDLEGLLNAVDNGNIKMEDEEYADANAIISQAWVNLDSIEAALPYMKLACEYVRDNELKGRYNYIKGQMYTKLGYKDSANWAFDEVIELNRKSPRIYMINAYIMKARNFDYEGGDRSAQLEHLMELSENWENRPYLDRIYNQIGEYYMNVDSVDTAMSYYNKSIRAYDQDRPLQALNYFTLAEVYFDRTEYRTAGMYYDSTLTFMEENTKDWRRTKKKRENLDLVVKLEYVISELDSIIRIARLSPLEQLTYYTNYTDELKAAALADSLAKAEAEKDEIANQEFFDKTVPKIGGGRNTDGGPFYFYNSSTVAYGKQEFRRIWGDRENEDSWRISSKAAKFAQPGDAALDKTQVAVIAGNPIYDPQTYLDKLPKDPKVIDSLAGERDMAYFEVGLIYKEKYKELPLAAERFETLLEFPPLERLILPTNYHLYKIYEELERPALADPYRNTILTNYPDSRYAAILQNPDQVLELEESSPEYKYNQLFKRFEAQEYTYVIEQCDRYIMQFFGDPIAPKFELLKSTALGRRDGFEAYKEGLNYVALTYPNTDEGKQARLLYGTVVPGLEKDNFTPEADDDKWKVVYIFESDQMEQAEQLLTKLKESISYYNNQREQTASLDYYLDSTYFVVLHGLPTKLGARNRGDALRENRNFKIDKPFFVISTRNYKTVQIHKNLGAYVVSDPTIPQDIYPQN